MNVTFLFSLNAGKAFMLQCLYFELLIVSILDFFKRIITMVGVLIFINLFILITETCLIFGYLALGVYINQLS